MKSVGIILKNARLTKKIVVRELSAISAIDAAVISKIENNKRTPTIAQLKRLSDALDLDFYKLKKNWLTDQVVNLIRYEDGAIEILEAAESRVEYLMKAPIRTVTGFSNKLQKLLQEIDILREQWQNKKPLAGTQLKKMREFFEIEYTYESNRIEGNTLTLQETQLVVNEGITIGGKSMREHLEAINHYEAVDFLVGLAQNSEDLTERTLLELHFLILKSLDKENAGRYRKMAVRISGSKHEPPQPYLLTKLMEDYFAFYKAQKKVLHPVILAAEMHERLVSIHPFIDGNGRTSRLIMNLILLKNGYTLTNLKGDNRSRLTYYKSLEAVQINNEPESFHVLVAQAVLRSLKAHLSML